MWLAARPERAQGFFLPLNVRFYGQETAYLSLAFDGPVACVNMEDFLGLSTGKNEHAQVTALVCTASEAICKLLHDWEELCGPCRS